MSEEKMNLENVQTEEKQRDSLDGGFAVVDREKLIEEETREITPWYKHFINVFVAPRQMMEENFYADPPKGNSVAIVGGLLFMIIAVLLTVMNPLTVEVTYEQFRASGIAEDMLKQKYMMAQISGVIGAVIGLFLGGLITAIGLQIAKLIAKDKIKFSMLYTLSLLSIMVSAAYTCIDRLIGYFIPTATTVLGLPILLSEELMTNNLFVTLLANFITLPAIVSIIILIIGYSVAARVSTKKSAIVILILQVVSFGISYGIAYVGQMLMQNMQMMM